MSRLAYKFLAKGARGPISGFAWSTPAPGGVGDWSPPSAIDLCRSGVHACRLPELAYWIHEELWRIELDGELAEGHDCLLATRGRLVARVERWSERGGARDFARVIRDRAQALVAHHPERERLQGYVDDASAHVRNGFLESPALAGLCTAMAVAQAASAGSPESLEEAYRRERAWQSAWIADEMKLGE